MSWPSYPPYAPWHAVHYKGISNWIGPILMHAVVLGWTTNPTVFPQLELWVQWSSWVDPQETSPGEVACASQYRVQISLSQILAYSYAGDCSCLISSIPSPTSSVNQQVLPYSPTWPATNLILMHTSGNYSIVRVTSGNSTSSCVCRYAQQTNPFCTASQLDSHTLLWVLQLN